MPTSVRRPADVEAMEDMPGSPRDADEQAALERNVEALEGKVRDLERREQHREDNRTLAGLVVGGAVLVWLLWDVLVAVLNGLVAIALIAFMASIPIYWLSKAGGAIWKRIPDRWHEPIGQSSRSRDR